MARGKRPVTFRTRKLSLSAPMVLPRRRGGRVGRRRTTPPEGAPADAGAPSPFPARGRNGHDGRGRSRGTAGPPRWPQRARKAGVRSVVARARFLRGGADVVVQPRVQSPQVLPRRPDLVEDARRVQPVLGYPASRGV